MTTKKAGIINGIVPILLIWLAVCAVMIFVSRDQIASGIGWGPDDQLRTVQLRDWLSGQSWFDVTQYRIGAPDSQPMHWPRLIEIPLAVVVLLLTPLVGGAAAEVVAMVAVPLIGLGIAMWLVMKITEQLFERKIALLAAALTATAVPLVAQLRPMRIDHHGWQIVLALTALWTMFWPDKRKGGIALGLALALWLSISLEGLPLSVAFIALLAWRWVISMDEGVRLLWTLVSFLGGIIFLYLGTQGSFDAALNYCDAISPVHIFACLAGGAIILPGIFIGPKSMLARAAWLMSAGGAALLTIAAIEPQCIGGAFGQIDPLVREYWYVNVREGLPIWHQPWKESVTLLGGSVVIGLLALGVFAWKRPKGIDGEKLFLIAYAFLWAFILSLLIQRAASVAAAFSLPLMAWLVHQAFLAARGIKSAAVRIIATSATMFLILPGPLTISMINGMSGGSTKNSADSLSEQTEIACDSSQSLIKLNTLPRSNIIAPFDFGPEILVRTPHNVLSTSHHRNDHAMADQIRIFTYTPEKARILLETRNIDYIVACPNEAELEIYAKKHPQGLWAKLSAKQQPDWLQTVHLRDSGLLLWRVKPKELRNAM